MERMTLPRGLALLTLPWLEEALRQRRPELRLQSMNIIDVMPGTSTKVRVAIVGDDGSGQLPLTLIIKGGFEEHSARMGPMYENEARFYADILPHINMTAPTCYFAASDPSGEQSIVILEDLKRPGVRFLNPLVPLDFEAVARRLRSMAVYHSQTWQSPLFDKGMPWESVTSRFTDWGLEYAEHYLSPDRWKHYMSSPRGAAVSTRYHDAEWMRSALRELREIETREAVCLIHGDTHLGNLYTEPDGTPGFFDAQVAKACWSTEVAYHIVCALDLADRRNWERALIEVYLEALTDHGIEAPQVEAAMTRYAQGIANGLFIFLINQTDFQSEAINTAYAARFGHAAVDHDLKSLIG